MERTISIEERIRRAEEIYSRRKMQSEGIRVRASNVNAKEKVKYSLFKKMILQILICFVIYLIFYLIKNSNYIFSDDVISKTREFLSYDINFENAYNFVTQYYDKNIKPLLEDNKNDNEEKQENVDESNNEQVENTQLEETEQENNEQENNEQNDNEQNDNEQNNLDGIGGGSEEENNNEDEIQLSQMELDANEIKANYSFIVPLIGKITSRYGPRTPTEIVSANHAGIDIAVNEGTVFVAAMEGNITTVSSYGSYGNHVYIDNGDVRTIYAHCKTIYVKEGDTIKQGQSIGEVGTTGNTTGAHLHFEIRKDGRTVNPEYVLSF